MKRIIVPAILLILSIGAGIYCGFAFFNAYEPLVAGVCTLAIVAFYPLGSVIHELGHMIFGAIVKIKAVPKFKPLGSSSCKIIPKTAQGLRAKLAFTALGGLCANNLFFLLGILALVVEPIPLWLAAPLPASAYLLALNAIPMRLPDGNTDGQVVSGLTKNDPVAQVTVAVLTAQAEILSGKSAAELDEKLLFNLPQIAEDEESFIALTELRYEYFKAKGDLSSAEKYKNRFEELKREYL